MTVGCWHSWFPGLKIETWATQFRSEFGLSKRREFNSPRGRGGLETPATAGLETGATEKLASQIVLEEELAGHGAQVDRSQFLLAFVGDPGFDQASGEDAAFEQKVVILLQCIENLAQ